MKMEHQGNSPGGNKLFELTNILASHAKGITILKRDVELAKYILNEILPTPQQRISLGFLNFQKEISEFGIFMIHSNVGTKLHAKLYMQIYNLCKSS